MFFLKKKKKKNIKLPETINFKLFISKWRQWGLAQQNHSDRSFSEVGSLGDELTHLTHWAGECSSWSPGQLCLAHHPTCPLPTPPLKLTGHSFWRSVKLLPLSLRDIKAYKEISEDRNDFLQHQGGLQVSVQHCDFDCWFPPICW